MMRIKWRQSGGRSTGREHAVCASCHKRSDALRRDGENTYCIKMSYFSATVAEGMDTSVATASSCSSITETLEESDIEGAQLEGPLGAKTVPVVEASPRVFVPFTAPSLLLNTASIL